MPAPNDHARPTTQLTTAGTSTNINVGSPDVGDLLIVYIRFMAAASAITFTGYTVLITANSTDAADDVTVAYYRWADGAEGASDAISWTTSAKLAAICWVVKGAMDPAISVPAVSSIGTFTTAANTANSNAATPVSAPQDVLYLTMMGKDGEGGVATAAPSTYDNLVTINTGTTGAVTVNGDVAGASKQAFSSASDDPGAWTHPAANAGGNAYTVAIRGGLVMGNDMANYSSTAVFMGGIRRAWHRRRTGIFVPDLWLPKEV